MDKEWRAQCDPSDICEHRPNSYERKIHFGLGGHARAIVTRMDNERYRAVVVDGDQNATLRVFLASYATPSQQESRLGATAPSDRSPADGF